MFGDKIVKFGWNVKVNDIIISFWVEVVFCLFLFFYYF